MGQFTSVMSSSQYIHNIYKNTKPCYACCFFPPAFKMHTNYYSKIEFACAYVKVNHTVRKE